jgi:hypothetical protein
VTSRGLGRCRRCAAWVMRERWHRLRAVGRTRCCCRRMVWCRHSVGKTASFFEFSLCLSRACLGKVFVFIYKWLKNAVFRRHERRWAAGYRQVRNNTVLFGHFLYKNDHFLPRQAQDKHTENSKQSTVFLQHERLAEAHRGQARHGLGSAGCLRWGALAGAHG